MLLHYLLFLYFYYTFFITLDIFSSAITTGGITVLIMTALMGEKVED